jgi:hypothetical protein
LLQTVREVLDKEKGMDPANGTVEGMIESSRITGSDPALAVLTTPPA